MVRGPPSQKLRTLREVISADRIARSRSDPVFVLQVPAVKTLPRVASEMALHVLAYNLTRVINIMGTQLLMAAMRA